MRRATTVDQLVGSTPVIRLQKVAAREGAEVWVKLEAFNPGGSVKDRIALNMVERAEAAGELEPGGTLVEPTSGNTGIGLAMVAATRGYRLVLVMPDSMSQERRRMLAALGARLELTPGVQGMRGAVQRAEELVRELPGAHMPQQFDNPANPEIHSRTTAVEIRQQVGEELAAFVAGVGTGGTITGVGRVLRREMPGTRIVAVEPAESPVLSGGSPGPHGIQGIGAGFVPGVLDTSLLDEIVTVTVEEARTMTRRLAEEEGLLLGISSGAAIHAAVNIARDFAPGQRVLTLAPDTGERYLSTDLFAT